MEDGISYARRIRHLGAEGSKENVVTHVRVDGTEAAAAWPELDRRSSKLAVEFAARGLGASDRLAIGLRNSPPFVLSALAAWKLGAVPVPMRWDLPDWELRRVRETVAARLNLSAEDLPWIDAAVNTVDPPDGDALDLPDVTSPLTHGICSSGSTGTPKVILTTRPAVYEPQSGRPFIEAWHPVPRPQTVLVLAPMYHANGFATLFGLLADDRLVVMEKFDAARVVDVIERHRVSTFTATPTMLQRIADLPGFEERDFSSIEWILQGAAPMPPSLVHRWAGLIGYERIVMAYGMSEGLGLTTLRGDEWKTHEGSVGRGIRGTEVRILDVDGRPVPTGELGEIYLRTPGAGGYRYLGGASRLRETEDGFQTAGDMGRLDEEGYLYLVDRRADLIVTGGANVYPAEVEVALIDHPKVADVVVIGLRDPEWGRRVHAVIEPADPGDPPTREDVVAYAKGRLAAYKVPKTIEIVEAIPRSAATKINRRTLVETRGG